ncbi:hypothetical protein [Poseidonocella sp. HB161398]|uniref:hypothetical protein n=1 Tax=Poseidonocella sp. HB161398 TaxID=2320855 RepID=UPI00197F4F67|nr:hypothetical protein [Poseidonocella sp. HB161398]
MALAGTLLLLAVTAYGTSMDAEDPSFAVLDRDQTAASLSLVPGIAGPAHFTEAPPLAEHADLDRRMRDAAPGPAIELPPDFARDQARGRRVEIGAWIDGAPPRWPKRCRAMQRSARGWPAAARRPASRWTPASAATPISTASSRWPQARSPVST